MYYLLNTCANKFLFGVHLSPAFSLKDYQTNKPRICRFRNCRFLTSLAKNRQLVGWLLKCVEGQIKVNFLLLLELPPAEEARSALLYTNKISFQRLKFWKFEIFQLKGLFWKVLIFPKCKQFDAILRLSMTLFGSSPDFLIYSMTIDPDTF